MSDANRQPPKSTSANVAARRPHDLDEVLETPSEPALQLATWEGPEDELLDTCQAAALLTVKPSTLSYWAREGRVPFIDLGPRHHRWTRPLLRQIIAERVSKQRV